MGPHLLKRASAALATLCGWLAMACTHAPAAPPATARVVTLQRRYLPERFSALKGNTQRVVDGVWCAGDRAFALPIVPFPEGPTEVDDRYADRGITSMLDMFDANESVVEIVRTQVRPDLKESDVLPGVAAKLESLSDPVNHMTVEWIKQNGRTQIQTVNPSEGYSGREDIKYLFVSHGWSNLPGNCRVDRHFVSGGYYFQIITIIHQPQERGAPTYRHDSCALALEIAAWTVENIRIGQGCDAGSSDRSASDARYPGRARRPGEFTPKLADIGRTLK